ncbi:MAG: lipid A biosynthesis acyltransferase [Chrysiogenales bacterium]|nr:MAG: lipid A biosynthesis acyltransferase [Chrysiogenales bacterium]
MSSNGKRWQASSPIARSISKESRKTSIRSGGFPSPGSTSSGRRDESAAIITRRRRHPRWTDTQSPHTMPTMAKPRKPWLDYLTYLGVRLVAALFLCFPIDVNLKTARLLGLIWWRLIPRHRQRAMDHVRQSFGSAMSEDQVRRIALASMQHLVMMVVEVFVAGRLITECSWSRHVRLNDLTHVMPHMLRDRPTILITGHYGNFELLGYLMARLGIEIVAVMRPLDNPYLNEWLVDMQQRGGLELMYKKGASQGGQDVLDRGGMLCFIADQDAGRKGIFVDFFGRKASTYKAIGLLAMRYNAPIIIGYARRCSQNFKYEVGITRVIEPHEWADRDDDLAWVTQEYTSAIEQFVRDDPSQYLWIHRRWKTRPKNERTA